MSKIIKKIKKSIHLSVDEEKIFLRMMEENGYTSANKFLRDLVFEDSNPISKRIDDLENEVIDLKNSIRDFKNVFAKANYIQTHMWIRSIAGIIMVKPSEDNYVIAEKQLEHFADKADKELKNNNL